MYLHKISLQPLFLQQTVHQYKSIDSMQLSKMVKGKGIRKKKKKQWIPIYIAHTYT